MLFQSAFPDTEFLVIPFEGFGITKSNWFASEYGVQRVLGELNRCGNQFDFPVITKIKMAHASLQTSDFACFLEYKHVCNVKKAAF